MESIREFDPFLGTINKEFEYVSIYANSHYVTPKPSLKKAIENIKTELSERVAFFEERKLFLEAQRIEQRTKFDLEMITATGSCSGIENYSRHLTGRNEGDPPQHYLNIFLKTLFYLLMSLMLQFHKLEGCLKVIEPEKKLYQIMVLDCLHARIIDL